MKRLFSEPLFQFGVVGVLLFLIFDWVGVGTTQEIVVTNAIRTTIAGDWQAQVGQVPTPEQLDNLVNRWVEDEMVFREARLRGLDEGDDIVRRRLVQKMRLLVEDEGVGPPAGEAELRAFFAANPGRYGEPDRVTFEHRFFSANTRTDPAADVVAALAGDGPGEGDAFLLDQSFSRVSQQMVDRHFGQAFAKALFSLPVEDSWQGPVESAYGQHAVRVRERISAKLPPYSKVAARVVADYDSERRVTAQKDFVESLKSRYAVKR